MNRREFLRSLVLVPIALATRVQIEEEWGISPIESFYRNFSSPSETFAKIGKKVFDGYVEGVQWYPSDRDEYGEPNWKLEMLGGESWIEAGDLGPSGYARTGGMWFSNATT